MLLHFSNFEFCLCVPGSNRAGSLVSNIICYEVNLVMEKGADAPMCHVGARLKAHIIQEVPPAQISLTRYSD